ncbi:MAG TPA: mechanosensitive ion channel family protein [Tissierellales bacterium]|nr:mechanosensitive ion channel family protein [Tissierellales bacterium]
MDNVTEAFKTLVEEDGKNLPIIGKIIRIAVIIGLVYIAIKVFNKVIDKSLERRKKIKFGMDKKKANTLAGILKNIIKYVFYFLGLIAVLDLFGIETSSLIATAGIGGLAIGFGAQSLVKDIITGFFIVFEEQFNVGDYVQIGEYEGIVEEIGLRVTKIRDFSGELHIIPNSNIIVVTNKTTGAMRALVEVSIPYNEDINKVIKILEEISDEVRNSSNDIIEGPNVLGISDLGEYNTKLTIIAKTRAMAQWEVEREIRKKIKDAFEREEIQQPYPKIVIMENKDLKGE